MSNSDDKTTGRKAKLLRLRGMSYPAIGAELGISEYDALELVHALIDAVPPRADDADNPLAQSIDALRDAMSVAGGVLSSGVVSMREQLLDLKVRELEHAIAHATRFVFGAFIAVSFHPGPSRDEKTWMVYPWDGSRLGQRIARGLTQAEASAMARGLDEESRTEGGAHHG